MNRYSIAHEDSPILDVIRQCMPFLDIEHGPWVAGGSARLIYEKAQLLGHSDIDVFFTSADHMKWGAGMIERHCRGIFERNPMQFQQQHSAPIMTMTIKGETDGPKFTIQLIGKIFRTSMDELLGSFDYEATQFVTDGYEMVARDDYEIGERILKIANPDRIGHVGRLAKYCSKGFFPAPGILSATLKVHTPEFAVTDALREVPVSRSQSDYNV